MKDARKHPERSLIDSIKITNSRTVPVTDASLMRPRKKISSVTGSKQIAQRVANGKQTGSTEISNGEQTGSTAGSKRVANLKSEQVANISTYLLVGNQLKLMVCFFHICKNGGSLTTPPVTLSSLLKDSELSTKGLLKNTLIRLVKKEMLVRELGKTGTGGWSRYTLPKHVYNDLNSMETGSTKSGERVAQRVAQRVASAPSSSIYNKYNNINTTTELPDDWKEINFFGLNDDIRFGKSQLLDIYEKTTLTPQQVERSLESFAATLKKERGRFTEPLKVIIGRLRKNREWTAPPNYEFEEDRLLREQLDDARTRQERRSEIEKELLIAERENWKAELSSEEHKLITGGVAGFADEMLDAYYNAEIWPLRRLNPVLVPDG